MKHKYPLFLFLFATTFSGGASAVDRGVLAEPGEYGSLVRLNSESEIEGVLYRFTCTGTLLSPRVVLTAAHCIPEVIDSLRVSRMNGREIQKVVEAHSAGAYSKEFSKADFLSKAVTDLRAKMLADFQAGKGMYPNYEKEMKELRKQAVNARRVASKSDLAFLVLEKAYEVSKEQVSTLACSGLPEISKVQFAGYGLVLDSQGLNSNQPGRLYHGENRLIKNDDPGLYELVYEPKIAPNLQMPNIGDSGGPLFSASSTEIVYGVSSINFAGSVLAGGSRLSYAASLASTSSDEAKSFYRDLLADPSVSPEIKRLLGSCL